MKNLIRFFASAGQITGASASASILLINIQGWFPLGFDLLAVQGTLKSLLWHHNLKASIAQCSVFFMVQLSHPYMTTGKIIALTIWTLVGKVMSLFFICCLGLLRRRQWHSTPVLLPGKSHGWRSLVGCSPWVTKSQTRLSDFTFTFHFHALEKEMASHSSVLSRRIPRTAEPGGLPSMGSESDTTEAT